MFKHMVTLCLDMMFGWQVDDLFSRVVTTLDLGLHVISFIYELVTSIPF